MKTDAFTDEEFLRRATLDITGTLPTPAQVLAFVNDKDPKKRDQLVDRVVELGEVDFRDDVEGWHRLRPLPHLHPDDHGHHQRDGQQPTSHRCESPPRGHVGTVAGRSAQDAAARCEWNIEVQHV